MKISEWLDEQVAKGVNVSQIALPADVLFDDVPDQTVFYQEYNPCGLLCSENHPYAKVQRFGRWYCCKGQDKKAGIHSSQMKWRLNTRDETLALQTAKGHME
jgi:hypothetical protein